MFFLHQKQKKSTSKNKEPIADIALLLEGTYPYIRGGVSSWVHQIISGLPEITFAIIFLGSQKSDYGEIKYEIPKNVTYIKCYYIMETKHEAKPKQRKGNVLAFEEINKLHKEFKISLTNNTSDLIENIFEKIGHEKGITHDDFLYSECSWNMICDYYHHYCSDPSFIDYFWSVRIMHDPIFKLFHIAKEVPSVKTLHSISTGYAGFLGSILHHQRQIPYILTEHGIYTKERKIDLAQAKWIQNPKNNFGGSLNSEIGHIRQLWINFFTVLGSLAYQAADPIISLYEGNRSRQIIDGAQANKTYVIPNGIDPKRFEEALKARTQEIPLILGLIGRVVPIKDIKTFIRSMRIVCTEIPQAQGWIIGPEDEDPDYVIECKELVSGLNLDENITFLGFQKIDAIFPKIGALVLSSISEALPLVILEAHAAGLPCIATDVGSCRELLEGNVKEDKDLGPSGIVTPIADPDALARAGIKLLTDKEFWHQAQQSGLKRVKKFYTQKMMFDKYRQLYEKGINQ